MPSLKDAAALEAFRKDLEHSAGRYKKTLTMCAGTACRACGCTGVADALEGEIERQGLSDQVLLRRTGCHGFCEQGPLAIVEPGNIFYRHIQPDDAAEVVERSLKNDEVVDRLLYTDPVSGRIVRTESEIPFYAGQDRAVLGANRELDPTRIEDYIARGGYSSLASVLRSLTPDGVIEEIKNSGLQGRGGGGYPTGRKWELCRAAPGQEHYVICNADEGDPGAYMDRALLEGNPHAVIEGMLIGAYAIGGRQGFVYVRAEYPLAVKHIKLAIEQARETGLLGERILGTDLCFDIKVARGGGAFICGESTALMASLEGRVGEPRPKDVHTVEVGYLNQPSNLNNVETWANIPLIIRDGAAAFSSKGIGRSRGTKIFALTGQVKNTGLVEVDLGTSLRRIIFDIGGGAQGKKQVKAVQTGGPSGGCLPVSLFDLPVDFEVLNQAGSMVGSGGMVVLDESSCMLDVAKYFLKFLQDESCGKCSPCRVGVGRMLEIVTDISEGRGTLEQLALLEDLAWTISVGSLCALGKTAPNPVLSTLRYFRDEYQAHIDERRCPAGVCRSLIQFAIDRDRCNECKACIDACPHEAILDEDLPTISADLCQKCGICEETCPSAAIGGI